MKRIFSLLAVILLTAFSATADVLPSDRLDVCSSNARVASFMVPDILRITYAQDGGNAFNAFTVELKDGTTASFNMEACPTLSYVPLGKDYLEILREHADHAVVVMLDCINNDHLISTEHPTDWTAQQAGRKVHFDIRGDLGYDLSYTITGSYTGTVYSDLSDFVFLDEGKNNLLGIDAWAFHMPNEPVVITAVATERTTYLGKDFVGTYRGYGLQPAGSLLTTADNPPLSMELKSNGSNHIHSSDDMAYAFADLYDFDESKQSFVHHTDAPADDEEADLEYRDQPSYGANGSFLTPGYVLVDIHDYNEDRLENTRVYLVAKHGFSCTVAQRDGSGFQSLVEATATADGARTWFFLTNYGYTASVANVEFLSGTSIGDVCEAYISYDGERQWKYIVGSDRTPQFIARGKESGTYTDEAAALPALTLDGFGLAVWGDAEWSYSADATFVTLTSSDGTRYLLLDTTTRQYSLITPSTWEGPESYANASVAGAYLDEAANTQNSVTLSLGRNLMGEVREGYAALHVQIARPGGSISAISDCQPFIYDAGKRQIWLTNVLTGDEGGGSLRRNILFQLSDDLQQAWLDAGRHPDQRLWSVSYAGSYVVVNQANALDAPVAVLPTLEEAYSATLEASLSGSTTEAEALLLINQDLDRQAREGYASLRISAMGTDIIADCVPYKLAPGTLTLCGVTVGDGNDGTQLADLVFTVTDDGRITGSGSVYSKDTATAFISVDLSSGTFLPALPGDVLSQEYTGKYFLESENDAAEVATVSAQLLIDRAADGSLTPGMAFFEVKCPAGKFGSKSVAYELSGQTLILKDYGVTETDSPDLVFTINADGTLQGHGRLNGTGSVSSFFVRLERAVLSPVQP